MGIKDLLKFMKPYIAPIHIEKYSGKRVGVDAYSWLHKGAYSCSMELALKPNSEKARRYLKYFMHHINLLRYYEIMPVVVFDGGDIPCKSATASDREREREANLALAKEYLDQENINAAVDSFQKAIRVTPSMAHQLTEILKLENIEFVVAPYEADSQLAYMSTLEHDQGGISAVITEDSDLMAYGCQAVIFKMDRYGKAEEILMDNVFNSTSDGLSFKHFDIELFTGMCVLAGCDFLPSVPGIGIKRAYSLVSKYRNLDRALSVLKFQRGKDMPKDYVESFKKAVAVFKHARIYDTDKKLLRPMRPLSEEVLRILDGDLDILGQDLPGSTARSIAEGRLNPITMEAFEHFSKVDDMLDDSARTTKLAATNLSFRHESQTSIKESCFTIFSASEMCEKNSRGAGTEQPDLGNVNYYKEAIALTKLLLPVKPCPKAERKEEIRVLPNNNPFRKRKMEDVDANTGGKIAEQVSEAINVENSTFCGAPESQKSANSKLVTVPRIKKVTNEKNAKINKDTTIVNKKNTITKFFMRATS